MLVIQFDSTPYRGRKAFYLNMLAFLKNILSRRSAPPARTTLKNAALGPSASRSSSRSAAAVPAAPALLAPARKPEPVEEPQDEAPPLASTRSQVPVPTVDPAARVDVPWSAIFPRLHPALIKMAKHQPKSGEVLCLPLQSVLDQLASGAVRFRFEEFVEMTPNGCFSGADPGPVPLVDLPLADILKQVDKSFLARRPAQVKVVIPDDIGAVFGGKDQNLRVITDKKAFAPVSAPASPAREEEESLVAPSTPPPRPPIVTAAPPPVQRAAAPPVVTAKPVAPIAPAPAIPIAPRVDAAPQPLAATSIKAPPAASAPIPVPPIAFKPEQVPMPQAAALNSAPSIKLPPPPVAPVAKAIPKPVPTGRPAAPAPPAPPPLRLVADATPTAAAEVKSATAQTSPVSPLAPAVPIAPVAPTASVASEGIKAPKLAPALAAPSPASTNGDEFILPLAQVATQWAAAGQPDLAALHEHEVAIPLELLKAGLKRGKLVFTWAQFRTWLRLTPDTAVPELEDALPVTLPLAIVAPLYLARNPAAAPQRKPALLSDIPDIFDTKPKAPRPTAELAAEPSEPAPDSAKPVLEYGEIFGQPDKTTWSLREVAERCATLRGVAGMLVANQEGLQVAGAWPNAGQGDVVAAFIPRMHQRMVEFSQELALGESNRMTLMVENLPLEITRTGEFYMAVLGKAKENLPRVQLGAIAARIALHNQV